MHDIPRTELVIGLVGAIGTDLPHVATRCGSTLTDTFGYTVETVTVSDLLTTVAWPDGRDLSPDKEDLRLKARMDAGRDLCQRWQAHDALAQLALLRISQIREQVNGDDSGRPLQRHAFILRSLKRPAEVDRLRAVFGSRFVLLGAYSPRPRRRDHLLGLLEKSYGTQDESKYALNVDRDLIERDERESGEGGQNVRGTFHQADFFVETHTDRLDAQLDRCLRILFGDPALTPTKDETAMAQADRAARRSAEPGRQVGAAIANDRGDILAVGCNEVPRAHGGQYWSDDVALDGQPAPDGREMRRPKDTNVVHQGEIASDVIARLRGALKPDALDDAEGLAAAILGSKLGDITEFGRAVHAEMAAITTAARLGVPLEGTTVLTDTFPCHNCARHIIGTGIERVVYIAPYAKSRAHILHEDAIAVAPLDPAAARASGKIVFEPFIGVAPRRFDQLFSGVKRKDESGKMVVDDFKPGEAEPRLGAATTRAAELDVIAYRAREDADLAAFRARIPELDPPPKEQEK